MNNYEDICVRDMMHFSSTTVKKEAKIPIGTMRKATKILS